MRDELLGFENFDDIENYDDEAANNYAGARSNAAPKRSASFDLNFKNMTDEELTVELFNAQGSFTEKYQPELRTSGSVLLIPQTSFEGLAAAGVGVVGFDQKGQLIATGAAGVLSLTVDCPQYGYRQLLKASAKNPFTIEAIRMTVTTDGQIDNEIRHIKKTFLGAKSENTINPRTSFRPEQNQGKIVDIKMSWAISEEQGLIYKLQPREVVKWNVIISR